MITAKFNGEDVKIPTSWSDVPYKKYILYTKTDNQTHERKPRQNHPLPYTTKQYRDWETDRKSVV